MELVLSLAALIVALLNPGLIVDSPIGQIANILNSASVAMTWAWHMGAARSGFQMIKEDTLVPTWIKKRYHLVSIYSFLMVILGFLLLLPQALAKTMLIALLNIAAIMVQFAAWVMPSWLKSRWDLLDENLVSQRQKDRDQADNLSEEDLMKMMEMEA